MWPDGQIRVGADRLALRDAFVRDGFSGQHDPTGVFIAAGGPIAPRAKRAKLSVLDIAPLIFYLAGTAIPDDLEGELPEDWISPVHLRAHHPRKVDGTSMPGIPGDPASASERDPGLTERLRALGYVE